MDLLKQVLANIITLVVVTQYIPWLSAHPSYLWTVPVVGLLAVTLLIQVLWQSIRRWKALRSQDLVLQLKIGRVLQAVLWKIVLVGIILWGSWHAGWLAWDQYRLRKVAAGLSWQADEFYQACCMEMKSASLTKEGKVRGRDELMPTFNQYPGIYRQIMVMFGHHELAQKHIIEDRPMPVFKDETEWRLMEEVTPPAVQPTPFGYRLCAYLLAHPRKTE